LISAREYHFCKSLGGWKASFAGGDEMITAFQYKLKLRCNWVRVAPMADQLHFQKLGGAYCFGFVFVKTLFGASEG
jgi:hypothetical protein